MTKGELTRMWAEFPDDTVLGIESPEGYPLDIVDVEPGITIGSGGSRHCLVFQTQRDDEEDEE